jgi:hypothetical protein
VGHAELPAIVIKKSSTNKSELIQGTTSVECQTLRPIRAIVCTRKLTWDLNDSEQPVYMCMCAHVCM